jgi:hypothetical protein
VLFGTGLEASEDLTTLPAGFVLDDIDCDVTANPSVGVTPTIDVTAGTVTFDLDSDGDVLDCTFFNEKQTGAILITKTRKHAADGPGDHPHEGVEFTISGGSLTLPETVTTDADGEACLDGLVFSSIVGDYTVTETVPPGYVPDGEESKTVSVTLTSTCGDGNEATVDFSNTPLTDLTVEVDSHVDGGTASTIDCVVASGSTDANGDGLVTASDLQPGTYICTIVIDP